MVKTTTPNATGRSTEGSNPADRVEPRREHASTSAAIVGAEGQERSRWFSLKLRDKLFLGSALLSSAILIVAAWVINHQVVTQARQQVQAEIEGLLPLYDAVWNEHARRLATLGTTMASSPIVKTVFGDPRASRDRETLREMITDFSQDLAERVDLILISDGAGQISFADMRGASVPQVKELVAARAVASSQNQSQGFAIIGGKLFQLVLTPVLLHSGSADYNNVLAVLGTGSELDRGLAQEFRQRVHSDVAFFVGDQLYASSLERDREAGAAQTISALDPSRAEPTRPVEVNVGGQLNFAFSRPLAGLAGERVGQVVVLRSLAGASELFRKISNRLLLLWSLSIAAALVLSYLIAERTTRPIEALVKVVREFGRGNYEYQIRTHASGEVGQLSLAFDQMRRSLKQTQADLLRSERLATIGQMAGSIIHDLRNPLATISTAADVLSRDGLPPERRRALIESQLRASQRMREMLKELLEFSRGSYELKLERHSLAELVERAIKEVSAAADRSGVTVDSHVPADLFVQADAERMRRAFENLLVNAIQAMPKGGAITVRADAERMRRARVRVDVIDTGPGVPAQIRERLFEPFVSHGKLGGTGLGLAIAQRIVEAHGGSIGLESTAGQGADFYLELPLETEVSRSEPRLEIHR